jgi:hypothetical protein
MAAGNLTFVGKDNPMSAFTLYNGLKSDIAPCPRCANMRHSTTYSITSSARASNADGIANRSVRAVLRLTTNSNFVDC